jgi:hypothetical protein
MSAGSTSCPRKWNNSPTGIWGIVAVDRLYVDSAMRGLFMRWPNDHDSPHLPRLIHLMSGPGAITWRQSGDDLGPARCGKNSVITTAAPKKPPLSFPIAIYVDNTIRSGRLAVAK